jgi:hypothetical protein
VHKAAGCKDRDDHPARKSARREECDGPGNERSTRDPECLFGLIRGSRAGPLPPIARVEQHEPQARLLQPGAIAELVHHLCHGDLASDLGLM